MSPEDILAVYTRLGFRCVTWERKENLKGPHSKGWNHPERVYDLALFDAERHNIGVFTGHEIEPGKFLIDYDLDWAPGIVLAKRLLPKTGFGFGRKGKKLSHAFYTTPERLSIITYEDVPEEGQSKGQTLIEIRGGDSSRMTMVAPSKHSEGVYIELVQHEYIAHVETSVILNSGLDYAIGCLVLRRVPGGLHHDGRLALAGLLLKNGFTAARTLNLLEAICEAQVAAYVPDMTQKDIDDCALVVGSTEQRLKNREKKVAGGPAFAKFCGARGKAIVARIAEWIGASNVSPDTVVMEGGELSAIVNRAEAALLDRGTPIYQRSGLLVRPVRLDTPTGESSAHAVRRDAGSMMLLGAKDTWLLEEMGRVLRWMRVAKEGFAPSDPEMKYARTLLARGQWRFPVLRGVVTAPTLDRHGRVLETSGLDAESGLLLVLDDAFPKVPDQPTFNDARAALERLAHPLRGFPFVDDAARSVALSALLTALIRVSLRTSPLHGFDAPAAGTGKSLLAELAGLLATGCRPPALSQGKNAEEDEKRLSTVLMAGDPVIHLDNCERPIAGDFLCSMLTQETVQARILGLSERRILPSTALVLASGNNLTFAGDTSRRAVICRLDAQVERPDTRVFDFDCHAEVLASRSELVVAGLTVLRAYVVAGRPMRLQPMGSFSDYEWIRAALVWLGCADPAETRSTILENDPAKNELVTVMDAWEAAVAAERIEVAEIENRADEQKLPEIVALRDLLVEVACHGKTWSGKSVGKWLARYRDKVVGGRAFRSVPEGRRWKLAGATERPHASPDEALPYEGDPPF